MKNYVLNHPQKQEYFNTRDMLAKNKLMYIPLMIANGTCAGSRNLHILKIENHDLEQNNTTF